MTINQVNLVSEISQDYLTYALSVHNRAIPDIRDGLRAASRRVIFGAKDLTKLTKCAKLDGKICGELSPHGSVYNTITELSLQAKHSVTPLIFQGNVGGFTNLEIETTDGRTIAANLSSDGAAAPRYTEVRLSEQSSIWLSDLEHITYKPNYDNTSTEPIVMAPQLPALLLMDTTGIAVGVSANYSPYNVSEVATQCKRFIEGKTIELIHPDFPCGGELIVDEKYHNTIQNGQGTFTVIGKALIESLPYKKGKRDCIVITELPPGVSAEDLSSELGEKVGDFTNPYVDIRDESSRAGVRIVVVPKSKETEGLLEEIYQRTSLRKSVGINQNALVNGIPKLVTYQEVIKHWYEYRLQIVHQRLKAEEKALHDRIHILEGICSFLSRIKEFDLLKLNLSILQLDQAQENAIRTLTINQIEKSEKFFEDLKQAKLELERLSALNAKNVILSEVQKFITPVQRKTLLSTRKLATNNLPRRALQRAKPEDKIREEAAALGMQRKDVVAFLKQWRKHTEIFAKWTTYVTDWKVKQEFETAPGKRSRREFRDTMRDLARKQDKLRSFNQLWKTIESLPIDEQKQKLKKELKLVQ